VNGIFRVQIAGPFSMLTNLTSRNCPGNNGNFADAIRPVKYLGGLGPNSLWFDSSSFAASAPNEFGFSPLGRVRSVSLSAFTPYRTSCTP